MTKIGARVIIANDDVQLAEIDNARLLALNPAQPSETKSSEAPLNRIRVATVATTSDATPSAEAEPDMPLKGTIDANATVESAIDTAVQTGMAEAESYLAQDITASVIVEVKAPVAAVKGRPGDSEIDAALRPGPISVYISRKQGRVYVRKGFEPVFDAPVTIAQPDAPLGTHVFTALGAKDTDTPRWSVVSLPTDRLVKKGQYVETYPRGELLRKVVVPPVHETLQPGDPNAALERIAIPKDALARITALMTSGATLIVSDLGISHETGRGTDFIVLTR